MKVEELERLDPLGCVEGVEPPVPRVKLAEQECRAAQVQQDCADNREQLAWQEFEGLLEHLEHLE